MTAIEKWNRRWGNSVRADPWWVLTEMRNTRACLADWKIGLGPYFPRVRPLLVLCIGQIAASYPSPGSNLRLRVRQREVGYLAHPVGEFDVDAEDLRLPEEDVQMWSLDWAKVEAAFGMGRGVDLADGKPVARVVGDFELIELPSGRVLALHKKHKRRAFLRAAHQWCARNKTDVFEWQTLIEDYNAQFRDPNLANRRIKTDRVDDDLFKGQQAEFEEIFGEPDRANGRLRFRVSLKLPAK